MLHAARIAIAHPVTGAALEFRAPLPDDFTSAMVALSALNPAKR
jgi:hypothetical protein